MTSEQPERMTGPAGATGATGAIGPAGAAGPAGPPEETAHVENAIIDVGQAELYISPGARRAAHRLAWSLVVLFVFTIAIGLANLLFTASQVHSLRATQAQAARNSAVLRKQLLTDCASDRDLAGLPLTNLPGKNYPSELGVKIISDFRGAFTGHGCPGILPPPSATFVAGAKFYHLPVN